MSIKSAISSVRRSTAMEFALEDVTFTYCRVGSAQKAAFQSAMDYAQWNVQVTAEKGTAAYDQLLQFGEAGLAVFFADEDDQDNSALCVNLRQYTHNAKGVEQPFQVVSSDFEEMTDEERAVVGDGSKGTVLGYIYENNNAQSEHALSARMTLVQIDEVVEFKPEMLSPLEKLKALRAAK